MSVRRHGNTNPMGQRNSNVHNETSSRNASRFKWTYEQEKTLIELYDQAISMNDYTLKDPTVLGREHMKWKFLMTSTGITVNSETSMIYASYEWWEDRESSSRQRRQQILTEGIEEDDLFDFSDNDGDDIPQHNVPQTQENEEIYRVNLSADTLPSHEYTHDSTRLPSRRGEERTRRGEVIEEDNHSRLQYKTPLMDIKNFNDKVYNSYAQVDYDEFKKAEQIFLALELPKFTKFYWACINALKELSPHSGSLSSGSPSSVGNCSRGNNFQNLGAPPGYTSKCTTLENTTKYATLGNTTKCSILGNITKRSTMGCTSKWSNKPALLEQHQQMFTTDLQLEIKEAHHKDRDVEVYSIFGELQKNLMKRIKVVQETKSSDLIV
ncbi:hypothetical protein HID58_034051, partial [Brassica napus]